MSKESELWTSIGIVNYGWDAFVKNDLTKWAEKKDLKLSHQKIRQVYHKNNPIKHTRGLRMSMPIENFVESPWVEWYKKITLPMTDWTISKYKEKFKRKLPEWVQSFSERKIDETSVLQDRYKHKFVIPEKFRSLNSWSIERELFIPDLNKKKKVVVERVYNARGICNKVTLVHIPGGGQIYKIRQEEKTSPHKWKSFWWFYDWGNDLGKNNCPRLIKLPNPWGSYLRL
jgi:hypothetical protein